MTRFTVNKTPVAYDLPADTPLLWALRDASNLTGTRYGCDTGVCGSCTVLIDGEPRHACRVSIGEIEGTFVTTIEGLSEDGDHPLQQAWLGAQVPQCGYCQSGMLMEAAALLARNPNPTRAEVREGMTVLCRCGTYPRVENAILHAAKATRGG